MQNGKLMFSSWKKNIISAVSHNYNILKIDGRTKSTLINLHRTSVNNYKLITHIHMQEIFCN